MHTAPVRLLTIVLAATCLAHPLAAQSSQNSEHNEVTQAASFIPTARGVDHFGVNVPDLEKGIAFFHDVLGADLLWKTPVAGLPSEGMQARYRVDPRAQVGLAMMRVGPSLNVELLEFQVPGQNVSAPAMDQVGAPHLGFYVDDVDVAGAWLEQHGCTLLGGPNLTPPGNPQAGQRTRYAATPLRLVIEVISRPAHLPYEEKPPPV